MIDALLIVVVLVTAVLIVTTSMKNGIGPVPTNRWVKERVISGLPESISGDVFDLGAGWGGVSLSLAKAYPTNKIIAVENALPVWMFCWLRVKVWEKLGEVNNLEVRLGDINSTDLCNAGLVYCYLYPGAMKKLSSRLQELSPGCVVISNTFSIPGFEPDSRVQASDIWKSQIYCYRI